MKWLLNISTLDASDGGPPNAVLRIAIELVGRGDSVTVVYLERSGLQRADAIHEAREAGVALHGIRVRNLGRFRFSLRQMITVWRLSRGSDVVTAHGFYQFTCVAAWMAGRMRRVPLFVQPHGVFEPYQEATAARVKSAFMSVIGRRILRDATKILVATDQEHDGVIESVGRWVSPRLALVGLGVAVGSVEEDVTRYQTPHVLFLSRIATKKRVDLLVEAIRLAVDTVPQIRLTVAGSGAPGLTAELAQQAAGLPIQFVGQVVGEAKQSLLSSCAVYCLPSDNENFGQAVVEAMSMGAPVITTNAVGASAHVLAADAGWVLQAPNPSDLATALIRALEDPDDLQARGARAAQYAEAELTWSAVSDRWRRLAVQ